MTVFNARIYPIGLGLAIADEGIAPPWHDCRDLVEDPRFRDVSDNAGYLDLEAVLSRTELLALHRSQMVGPREFVRKGMWPSSLIEPTDDLIEGLCAPDSKVENFRVVVSEDEP